ncbi:MAG: hypothetical protein U9R29_06620 [Thermodesulfobacteriota bacterium]|nr:hypothetical protein [Thermodesulfobacteriota bacterium]
MCYRITKLYQLLLIGIIIMPCVLLGQAHAESLFEQYTTKNAADLKEETCEMGQQLKSYFNADNISSRQRQIDFSEYRSNFKKTLLYGTRLSTYSEYERDLEFARDKEIFKGLPQDVEAAQGVDANQQRQDFMAKKYQRMQQNVEGEISTYSDLLLIALETCESTTRQDISGIQDDAEFIDEMRDLLRSDEARHFQKRQTTLAQRWPTLNQRITAQMTLWQTPAIKPNAPIIDPQIIEAL